jgi:hypothetical protein
MWPLSMGVVADRAPGTGGGGGEVGAGAGAMSRLVRAFRKVIEIAVIDPSAPYASGIRAAPAKAFIVVDKWHVVALANPMVTEVRQRSLRNRLGAAPSPTPYGSTAGCCSPGPTTCQPSSGGGSKRCWNDQLPAPYPQPYWDHPAVKSSSMTGIRPRSRSVKASLALPRQYDDEC